MELSNAFRERLEHMEHNRNERLSLLQTEKEAQANKSQILASKLAIIRLMEQRCLLVDQKISSHNFKISSLKSEIEILDAKYQDNSQKLRVFQGEMEELEEIEKEKEKYYELKGSEMKEFGETVENFVKKCRLQVEELGNNLNKLNSTFDELQGNNGHVNNPEIAAAEVRKSELLAMLENVNRNLASNNQLRAQLQKQLQNILTAQNQRPRKRRNQFASKDQMNNEV